MVRSEADWPNVFIPTDDKHTVAVADARSSEVNYFRRFRGVVSLGHPNRTENHVNVTPRHVVDLKYATETVVGRIDVFDDKSFDAFGIVLARPTVDEQGMSADNKTLSNAQPRKIRRNLFLPFDLSRNFKFVATSERSTKISSVGNRHVGSQSRA